MWPVAVHTCTYFHLRNQSLSYGWAFIPFTFKVIMDMYESILIFSYFGFILCRSFPSVSFLKRFLYHLF